MRGSIFHQVNEVFHKSGLVAFGQSKHKDKDEAREAGARTWADLGRELKVYSYATADAYRDVWGQCLAHAKAEHGVKDIEKLGAGHVGSFLKAKAEGGESVSKATFRQYAAALGKLEAALNGYAARFETGRSYDFRQAIKDARPLAASLRDGPQTRAYAEPQRLVAAIKRSDHRLAARMQYEGGPRVHEISLITPPQLLGERPDPVSGKTCGWIADKGKGGKNLEHKFSLETYRQLAAEVERRGAFSVDKAAYRESLKSAAEDTGQDYRGSHGLRWNFAQERFAACQAADMGYELALVNVSRELGHERPDITEHYLR